MLSEKGNPKTFPPGDDNGMHQKSVGETRRGGEEVKERRRRQVDNDDIKREGFGLARHMNSLRNHFTSRQKVSPRIRDR